TLHASNAIQTVERIIDVFPPHQQSQIRVQLANTILGIFSQQLVPKIDGSGRVLATEVLVANPAVRNLIRENKAHQLHSVMQTGVAQGMITMEKALSIYVERGIISKEEMKRRLLSAT
ncbi:MAG: type IV pili twitching motility protein PilT, partial [Syntrophomonadaceae bacterium]